MAMSLGVHLPGQVVIVLNNVLRVLPFLLPKKDVVYVYVSFGLFGLSSHFVLLRGR
jgi:hypothetical protein